jgi:hypothetical protein
MLGASGVAVFVFMVCRDHTFIMALAVMVSILDAGYIALLLWRRRSGRKFLQARTTHSTAPQSADSWVAPVSI